MIDPAQLRAHYSAFLSPGRVLLTGHSHQAWPNVARQAQLDAFEMAAAHADDKWDDAFRVADELRAIIAGRIGAGADEVALAPNTHELVCRFLSALDLAGRPHLVTTRGEFHSITRQLQRLEELGSLAITWVDAHPVSTLAERLAAATTDKTAAVLVSTVLFGTSHVVPNLAQLVPAARRHGAHVLLDAYHAFFALPFDLRADGLGDAFMVGGGYKYAQWGEGNCFLRVPPGLGLRPVLTGWYAGFAALHSAVSDRVAYGTLGKDAFAGATYDPTSHYRAVAVARFMERQGMTANAMRDLSLAQTARLMDRLGALEIVTPQEPTARGAFVSVRTPRAAELVAALRTHGIFVDSRGDLLRLGPAPYLSNDEIDQGAAALLALMR
jgi:kynureninase